jgi:hypothetical protein
MAVLTTIATSTSTVVTTASPLLAAKFPRCDPATAGYAHYGQGGRSDDCVCNADVDQIHAYWGTNASMTIVGHRAQRTATVPPAHFTTFLASAHSPPASAGELAAALPPIRARRGGILLLARLPCLARAVRFQLPPAHKPAGLLAISTVQGLRAIQSAGR